VSRASVRPLDWLRSDSALRVLRDHLVLAFSGSVAVEQIEDSVRLWDPGATRDQRGRLAAAGSLRLDGPFPYDETLWRRAKLPPEATTVYAVTADAASDEDWMQCPLVWGICRRLGGRSRGGVRSGWQDRYRTPAEPRVYVDPELPREDVVDLLAPHLPGLETVVRDYFVDEHESEDVNLDVVASALFRFPLIRAQPWFSSWDSTAEYALHPHDTPRARRRAEQAAHILADAAGGLVLDEDGFPWPNPT
jgi:hypothetical protein